MAPGYTSFRDAGLLLVLLCPQLAAQDIVPGLPAVATGDTAVLAPLTVSPEYGPDRWVRPDQPLRVRFSRPLARSEGRPAVLLGRTDVTALTALRGSELTYRPARVPLPRGETELVVYLVSDTGAWHEVGRLPVKLLTTSGFEHAAVIPKIDLVTDGELGQGHSPVDPQARGFHQDLTASMGFQSAMLRQGWSLETQANAVGVSREEQRLRFNQRGVDAPAFDLSDYLVELGRGPASVALGHTSFGANRHLVSGFSSRGIVGGLRLGPGTQLGLAALNGSSLVGWNNPLGLASPDHRIWSATLGVDLIPSVPGAVHLDATVLDGSLLPVAGFNQGVVNDAEESRGAGLQLTASDPRQRFRLAAGLTRSRFTNPADELLSQGASVVAVRTSSRSARYLEAGLQLLQNHMLGGRTAANLSAGFRHERVDPLFRSIAAGPRADWDQNVLEATAGLGPLSLQYAHSRARDNLADVPSILTTRTRDHTLNGALPLGALLRAPPAAWWWPLLNLSYQVNRQRGDGVPVNGGFNPSHVPDQLLRNATLGLGWQLTSWSLAYRHNVVRQDNRQPGRELADFRSWVHALTLGVTPASAVTLSLDLSDEHQRNLEFATVQRTRRAGLQGDWRLLTNTAFQGFVSFGRSDDSPSTQQTDNTELRFEASQGFNLYRRPESGTQARAFLRYGRNANSLTAPALAPTPDQTRWSLAAGMSLRLY
ncbi:hypothetical protein BH24GEM1_BH24GEM1_18500 [soil metagenome]